MTFAAEEAGRTLPTNIVAPTLRRLLTEDPSPLVREGACLGLAYHLHDEATVTCLRAALHADPSEGVRITARDILEEVSESH